MLALQYLRPLCDWDDSFRATLEVEAFDWDCELGLQERLDDRTVPYPLARMRLLHEEILKKSVTAKAVAEKFYNKNVEEKMYEGDDRGLIYDFEGSVKAGGKIRVPWLGTYKVVEKVTDINCILEAEEMGRQRVRM